MNPRLKNALDAMAGLQIPYEVKRVTGMSPTILIDSNRFLEISMDTDSDFVTKEDVIKACKWWVAFLKDDSVDSQKDEDGLDDDTYISCKACGRLHKAFHEANTCCQEKEK